MIFKGVREGRPYPEHGLQGGLHRALRSALYQRPALHARVLDLPDARTA